MQRSYNAFAVRVLDEEGGRRVVHASETTDGDLCIEMRIRLYPDGLMSNVLSQLIKVSAGHWMIEVKMNHDSGYHAKH